MNRKARRGDFEGRRRLAERYARSRPGDPFAWKLWGWVLRDDRQWDEALQVLHEGLQRHPDNLEISALLADVLRLRGDSEEARATWLQLLSRYPDSPLPYTALAMFASVDGDARLAQELAKKALARDPSPQTLRALAALNLWFPSGRDTAVRLLERSMKHWKSWTLRIELAVVLEETNPERATRLLREARRLCPLSSQEFKQSVDRYVTLYQETPTSSGGVSDGLS